MQYTLYGILERAVEKTPHGTSLKNRVVSYTYAGLQDWLNSYKDLFMKMGVGPGTRIAILVESGLELAMSHLLITGYCSSAPLNKRYTKAEHQFYLDDIKVDYILAQAGDKNEIEDLIEDRDIGILTIDNGQSGRHKVELVRKKQQPCVSGEERGEEDTGLILHTSGTTSRPKKVLLSQSQMWRSATGIQSRLEIGPDDTSLNMMPLFHIHSLIGVLGSSLVGGACVFFIGKYDPGLFSEAIDNQGITWYSCAPSIHHQVIQDIIATNTCARKSMLRFVRSSSSPLPVGLIEDIYNWLGVPVIEAYGMTEAAHEMACNPLRGKRKAGSVGRPTNVAIQICTDKGEVVSGTGRGEIVISGKTVITGYETDKDDINKDAFFGDWFRTGDEGYFDEDGYLFITGRLKEQINKGGEKIAPKEIDDVLLEHPEILQAATFSIDHAVLGEDLAAMVVTTDESSLTSETAISYMANKVADYKVPRAILIVDEIPKGPTGKVQRHLLKKWYVENCRSGQSPESPADTRESFLVGVWRELLNISEDRIGVQDNFFDLGGYSLISLRLLNIMNEKFGTELIARDIFENPTIRQLAQRLDNPLSVVEEDQVDDDHLKVVPFIEQLFLGRLRLLFPGKSDVEYEEYMEIFNDAVAHTLSHIQVNLAKYPRAQDSGYDESYFHNVIKKLLLEHPQLGFEVPAFSENYSESVELVRSGRGPDAYLLIAKNTMSEQEQEMVMDVEGARIRQTLRCPLFRLIVFPDKLMLIAHHLVRDGYGDQLIAASVQRILADSDYIPRSNNTIRATNEAVVWHIRSCVALDEKKPVFWSLPTKPKPVGGNFRIISDRFDYDKKKEKNCFGLMLTGVMDFVHDRTGQKEGWMYFLKNIRASHELPVNCRFSSYSLSDTGALYFGDTTELSVEERIRTLTMALASTPLRAHRILQNSHCFLFNFQVADFTIGTIREVDIDVPEVESSRAYVSINIKQDPNRNALELLFVFKKGDYEEEMMQSLMAFLKGRIA